MVRPLVIGVLTSLRGLLAILPVSAASAAGYPLAEAPALRTSAVTPLATPPVSVALEAEPMSSEAWTPGRYDQSASFAGLPKPAGYPHSVTILTNAAFVIGYDETTRNAAWAAYRLSTRRFSGGWPRPKRFFPDLRTVSWVRHDDYTGTGYDRGHLVPSFAMASHFGAVAQRETFVMTNVVPQSPALNRGPWRLLETLTRRAAEACGTLWVVVGPIYSEADRRLGSGVRIPDAFYCLVTDELMANPRFQAFVLPQGAPGGARFLDYLTTVDAVELATGLDFFHELPDLMEQQTEQAAPTWWLD